ncbi:MAG: protein kinase [Planctomycetes bacterium]|nr:protein kinase [Planctomycetota bacterium]
MNAPLDALERLLLDQVDAARGQPAGSAAREPARVAALRAELAREAADAQETLDFGKRVAQLLPGESPSDARLGLRFERAIAAALAAGGATIGGASLPPRIVVLRDDAGGDTRRAGSLDGLGATLSRDPRPALVLAGEQARAALEQAGGETLASGAAQVVALPPLPAPVARAVAAQVAPKAGVALAPGDWISGKYRIVREIGRGGFGAVFEARDETLGSRVAIKVMNARAACTAAEVQEFKDEARRVTRLSHPNIVDWKSFDELPDGSCCFVMELLEGEDLETRLKREKRLPPKVAMELTLQIVDALRAAHHLSATESILHLDLKPRNVFLVRGAGGVERVKVIDFGIGQYVGGAEKPAASGGASGAAGGATAGGASAGSAPRSATSTLRALQPAAASSDDSASAIHRSSSCTPEYASPEQCAHLLPGRSIVALDGRSDLYSLGVMAYQMVTGELPFTAPKRRMDWLEVHLTQEARRLADAGAKVPRAFAQFVDRCLRRDREQRFATSAAAFAELDRVVHPPLAQQLRWAAPLLLVLLAATGFIVQRIKQRDVADALAKARFPLFELESDRPIAEAPLWFGPERATQRLRASDLALAPGTELLLADARGRSGEAGASEARAVDGFRATVDAGGQIVVEATAEATERLSRRATLRVVDGPDAGRRSVDLELVWIGGAAWSLGAIEVAGRRGRALDPRGQSLSIEVVGAAAADLERLAVRVDGREVAATATQLEAGRSRFEAPLAALFEADAAAAGTSRASVQFEIEARDRSGRRATRRFPESEPLPLVASALAAESAPRFTALRSGERWFVGPRAAPRFQATLQRPATLVLAVRDVEGNVLREWSEPRALAFDLDLAEVKALRGGAPYAGRLAWRFDESESVARAPERSRDGELAGELPFDFSVDEVDFAATLDVGDGPRRLVPDAVVFTCASEASLALRRVNAVPAQLQATMHAPDGSATVVADARLEREVENAASGTLSLPAEGVVPLQLRGWRVEAGARGGPASADPERDWRALLVVDRSAPSVALRGFESPPVVRRAEESLPELVVELADPPIGGQKTPARVSWRLERSAADAATGSATVVRRGTLAEALVAGEARSFAVPRPWEESGVDADGEWRLVVEAHDAAGNPPTIGSVGWRVSLAGPAVELLQPSPLRDFNATLREDGTNESWFAEVRARDDNGVAQVTALARPVGAGAGARAIAFELAQKSVGAESYWSGWLAEPFPFTWSGREIEIEVRATDRDGTVGPPQLERRRLPTLHRFTPERIVGGHGLRDAVAMVRVRGNDLGRYVFGGQVEAEENRLFVAAGLPLYAADAAPPRSWQQEVAAGAIEDLYVDATEVTQGQFLAFLADDERGYRSAAPWSDGRAGGDAQRADELLVRLLAEPPELPMTGVDWHEADAFARWCGKRLPTLLEWEWTVRGPGYRPWAGARSGVPLERERLRVGRRDQGPGAVGGDGALDATPEGIVDLCSNVAEWTATSPDPADPASRERFAAGGAFDTTAFDFAKVEVAWIDARRASLGFRCVVAARVALDSMERDDAERFRRAPTGGSR